VGCKESRIHVDMILKLPWTQADVNLAHREAQRMGCLDNSITKGKANKAGILAEIVLARHLGIDRPDNFKYDWDLKLGNTTIEVKTKRRTVPPRQHYDVSIATTSLHQRSDLYAFVSLDFANKDSRGRYTGLRNIYLCGFYPNELYKKNARKIKKGDVDKQNNFTCHVDMINLPISELFSLTDAMSSVS